MFRRTNSGVLEQLKTKKFKTRFSIFDWHPSIEREEAFTRITKVTEIKPGDVAAWLYTEKVTHTLPGHILFIDSPPVKLEKPRKPLVDGLDQYEVTIIDTSQEAKSRDDTRFVSDAALRDENEAKGKQRGSVASPTAFCTATKPCSARASAAPWWRTSSRTTPRTTCCAATTSAIWRCSKKSCGSSWAVSARNATAGQRTA